MLFEFNMGFRLSTEKSHCSGNPCQNGGKCNDTGDNFQCDCQNGFTGKICQIGKTRFLYKIYRPFLFYRHFFFSLCHYFIVIFLQRLVVFWDLFFCASTNSWTTRGKTNSLALNQWIWTEQLATRFFSLSKNTIVLLMNTCCSFHKFCGFIVVVSQIKRGNMCASITLHTSCVLL